mgnify:CR=1 FL=1
MSSEVLLILFICFLFGQFIFLKGFQENLGIMDIILIFLGFTGFFIGFVLIFVLINNLIKWIFSNLTKLRD